MQARFDLSPTTLLAYNLSVFFNHRSDKGFLCNKVLDLVCQTKQNSYVSSNLGLKRLSTFLPFIMHKVFDSVPFGKSLSLVIDDYESRRREAASITISSQLEQSVNITIRNDISADHIATSLFTESGTPFNVDLFSFDCSGTRIATNTMNVNTFDKMLRKMPSLKEIRLDLPLYYVENDSTDHNVYPLVEKATLQSTTCMNLKFQTLIDRCAFIFPNIKHLNLYTFSGGDSLVKYVF